MRNWLLLLSLWVINAVAQQDCSWEVNHYKETKTFVEDGYTYQCDVNYGLVTLYNKENKWTYEDQIDKQTGEVYNADSSNGPVLQMDEETYQKILKIINESFSYEETKRITDNGFITTLYVNPETGNINEVCYNFSIFSNSAQIPIAYYRDIEQKVKKQIQVTVTERGKLLNYIMIVTVHAPTKLLPSINQ